jgi:uncharacterized protein YbjT (DUF2867 family)
MVIGADTALGETVVRRLLRTGGQVRVYVDPDRDDLVREHRELGCKVARGTLDDEGRLEIALTQVHTVIHAADSLLDSPDEVVDGLATVAEAATGANVRRIVWPSWLGAGEPEGEWLRMCAEAESLLAALPFESVVVRRALTYGPGDALTVALAADPPPADAPHAPLWLGDLAQAMVEADRQRGEGHVTQVRVDMAGPDVVSVREFAARVADRVGRLRGLALPAHCIEYLSRGAAPPPGALGATGMSVDEGLRRLERK